MFEIPNWIWLIVVAAGAAVVAYVILKKPKDVHVASLDDLIDTIVLRKMEDGHLRIIPHRGRKYNVHEWSLVVTVSHPDYRNEVVLRVRASAVTYVDLDELAEEDRELNDSITWLKALQLKRKLQNKFRTMRVECDGLGKHEAIRMERDAKRIVSEHGFDPACIVLTA